MKNMLVLLFLVSLVSNVTAQDLAALTPAEKSDPTAAFHWANTTYDFGKTKVGKPVSYEFRFKNTGLLPLVISSVKASCGCTVTAYTKEPVEHGASGIVSATYNAAKVGTYSKTVAVTANTLGGVIHLTIKGEIVE